MQENEQRSALSARSTAVYCSTALIEFQGTRCMWTWPRGPTNGEQERGPAWNQIRAIKIQKPIARTGRRLCGNCGRGGVRGNPQRRQ
jgi:hypothetical protein